MPTKAALVALAVVATTIAGCADNDAGNDATAAQPAAGTASAVTTVPSTPAGNGVAALGADEILQRAKAALKRAKTFRVKGTMVDDGQKMTVNLQVDGADFAGTIAMGAAKLELLAVGGKKFIKPNEQFWVMSTDAKQGKALAKAVNGRWIAGADNDASFAEIFGVGAIDGLLKPTGALSKGAEKEIAGVPAVSLKDAGDADSVLWVATTGEPYPLRITGKDGGSPLVFSGVGEPATGITKPTAAQIVDLGKLKGA